MTEQEAIKAIEHDLEWHHKELQPMYTKVLRFAIKALEEIQQYRALEEKLNGISVEQVVSGFISTVEKQTQEDYKRGRILTNKEADEWNELQAIGTVKELRNLQDQYWKLNEICKEYSAIGTVEEFKALKEKSVKVICPICGKAGIGHCDYCGQDLEI